MIPRIFTTLWKSLTVLSIIIFHVGAALGIYTRWQHHSAEDNSYVLLAIVVTVAILISLASYLYGYRDFASAFSKFWMGVMYSVLAFTKIAYDDLSTSLHDHLDVTDILVISSVVIFCFKILVERIFRISSCESGLITTDEFFLWLGFLAGCSGTAQFKSLFLLLLPLILHIAAFHLKSSASFLSYAVFCIISGYFFTVVKLMCNPFCISAFVLQLSFSSVIDLSFSRLSLLKSWNCIIMQGRCYHRLEVILILITHVAFYIFCMQGTLLSPFYKIPIFVLLSFLWGFCQIMFIITCWVFGSKLEECVAAAVKRSNREVNDSNISKAMASKGIRNVCLVSWWFTFLALLTTVLLALVASLWQEIDPMYLSFLFIVLPIELVMCTIFSKLGKSIGGTVIGYALIAPTSSSNPSTSHAVNISIQEDPAFDDDDARPMQLRKVVLRFFTSHMIYKYGVRFSTDGIGKDFVTNKVKDFFNQRGPSGLHYDTYVLYYCGPVLLDGSWELADGNNVDFDTILQWWRYNHRNTGARLILVLDTAHSDQWLTGLWQTAPDFIAIQTGQLNVGHEFGSNYPLGELTKLWVDFNACAVQSSRPEDDWRNRYPRVKPIYGVSQNLCNFKFHKLAEEDIAAHIDRDFPRFMKPVAKLFAQSNNDPFWLFYKVLEVITAVLDGYRKLKMKWFLPVVYDTGNGFKLVRKI